MPFYRSNINTRKGFFRKLFRTRIIQVLTVFTADFNLSQASIHLKFLEEKYFVLSIVKILMKEREKCDKL